MFGRLRRSDFRLGCWRHVYVRDKSSFTGGKDRAQVSPRVIANLYMFLSDMEVRQTKTLNDAIDRQEKGLKEAISLQDKVLKEAISLHVDRLSVQIMGFMIALASLGLGFVGYNRPPSASPSEKEQKPPNRGWFSLSSW
jgi:hypothetical protein